MHAHDAYGNALSSAVFRILEAHAHDSSSRVLRCTDGAYALDVHSSSYHINYRVGFWADPARKAAGFAPTPLVLSDVVGAPSPHGQFSFSHNERCNTADEMLAACKSHLELMLGANNAISFA